MAESTLHATYTTLRADAAVYLGYGDDSSAWTATGTNSQAAMLTRVLSVGLRRGYFPPPVTMPSGQAVMNYRWTWMQPGQRSTLWETKTPTSGYTATVSSQSVTATGSSAFYGTMTGKTITFYDSSNVAQGSGIIASVSSSGVITMAAGDTVSDGTGYRWGIVSDGNFRLPDEFGTLDGAMYYDASQNARGRIENVSISRIRHLRQNAGSETGMPSEFAIAPVDHFVGNPFNSAGIGQRFNIAVWPIPSSTYTVIYKYTYLPSLLTSELVYHGGGMPYSEMFRCSVLAACEEEVHDQRGLRYQLFTEALISAINYDMSLRPQNFGRNRDTGIYDDEMMIRHGLTETTTTYNGLSLT